MAEQIAISVAISTDIGNDGSDFAVHMPCRIIRVQTVYRTRSLASGRWQGSGGAERSLGGGSESTGNRRILGALEKKAVRRLKSEAEG